MSAISFDRFLRPREISNLSTVNYTHHYLTPRNDIMQFTSLLSYLPICTLFFPTKVYTTMSDFGLAQRAFISYVIYSNYYTSKYDRLLWIFTNNNPMLTKFEGRKIKLYVGPGILLDRDYNILICLTLDRVEVLTKVFNMSSPTFRFNPNKFRLYISKNFQEDFPTVFRRFKPIIETEQLEIVYTNRLNDLKYRAETPNFVGIEEMQEYIKINAESLFYDQQIEISEDEQNSRT